MNKILILEQGSEYGGVNKILNLLLNALQDEGEFECSICFLYKAMEGDAQLRDNENVYYIHQYSYPNNRIVRLLKFAVVDSLAIYRLLKREKPDWVVSFGSLPLVQIVKFKALLNYKVLVSERNDPYLLNDGVHKYMRRLYDKADIVVFQSDAAKRYFPDGIQQKSVVIANPVEEPVQRWTYQHARKIITVGRIENKQKRGDILIKAFSKFVNQHKDFQLEFVGSGTESDIEELKQVARMSGVYDKVIFSGYCPKPVEKLLTADLFVLSSDYEGMPNALLEAMSIGMPVVSTNYSPGGVDEIIQKDCGIVVKRGDENALADAVSIIIDNPDKASEYGGNAYERMKLQYKSVILYKWKECLK